jgi:hypothetical protein
MWFSALSDSYFVITLIVDAVVLTCLIPAYRRSRHPAFLYLMFAYLIGIFLITADYTIGQWHMSHNELVQYRTLRYFLYFADVLLSAAGVITLTRSYLSQSSTREDTNSSV